jgi:hypothetical protein
LTTTSNVTVKVFTAAYRKVKHFSFPNTQPGQVLTLPLNDEWGMAFANGIYYLVVDGNGQHWILKLLVLR